MKLFSSNPLRPGTGGGAVDPTVANARTPSSDRSSRSSAASQQRYAASKDAHKQHSARGRFTAFVSNLFGHNPARNPSRATAFNSGASTSPAPSSTRNAPTQAPSGASPSLPAHAPSPASGRDGDGLGVGGSAQRGRDGFYTLEEEQGYGGESPVRHDAGGPTAQGSDPTRPDGTGPVDVGTADARGDHDGYGVSRTTQGPPGADHPAEGAPPGLEARAPGPLGHLTAGDKDWAITKRTALKAGQFNTPSMVEVTRTVGTVAQDGGGSERAVEKTKVYKPEVPLEREYGIHRAIGVTSVNLCMVQRNVATSIVAKELGTKTVPTSHAGTLALPGRGGRIEPKPVLAMSLAKGDEAFEVLKAHPGLINNPSFQRQMSNVETTAFLTGNPDNHLRNYMIHVDPGAGAITDAEVKVALIDNDLSFGAKMVNPDRPPPIDRALYRHTGLPAYMDAEACTKIETMDRDAIAAKLGFLDDGEVEAFKSRFDLLQAHVAFLKDNNRVVSDWASFTNAEGSKVAGDSYFAGTLAMSGVDQGQGTIVPRSMILRECQQAMVPSKDLRATLAPYLSEADRTALAAYGDAADLVVPPSGRPEAEASLPQEIVTQEPSGEGLVGQDPVSGGDAGAQAEGPDDGGPRGGGGIDGREPARIASGPDGVPDVDDGDEEVIPYENDPIDVGRAAPNPAVAEPPGGTGGTDPARRASGDGGYTLLRASDLQGGAPVPEAVVQGRPRANAITERPAELDAATGDARRV